MKKVLVYIVSDSVGETAQKVVDAVTAQFIGEVAIKIMRFGFVTSETDLVYVLKEALEKNAIVVATIVNQELITTASEFAENYSLELIDLMSPLTKSIIQKTGIASQETPGAIYTLDDCHADSLPAIEFAKMYDDGKNPQGFKDADIVILGISRSAKTPLSMYLAVKSYRVANLPLIPEVPLPKELFDVPPEKIFGLVGDSNEILEVRKSRLEYLGLEEDASYATLERIETEMSYAQEVFDTVKARRVEVGKRSIEEVAAKIEELIKK